jgi:hypothetical protein
MMIEKQAILRFAHPCGELGSSQWRQKLKSHANLSGVNLDDFVVSQSGTALSISARIPSATPLLHERVMDFMRSVADIAGRTLEVQILELSPGVAFTHHRWNYFVPKWVVGRPKDDWKEWLVDPLPDSLKQKMQERLNTSLGEQLKVWSDWSGDLDLKIEDYGRPMFLKDAIAQGPKPMGVAARLNVCFSSSQRIEGAFYAGYFNVTGFGRIYRNGSHEE